MQERKKAYNYLIHVLKSVDHSLRRIGTNANEIFQSSTCMYIHLKLRTVLVSKKAMATNLEIN